MRILIDIAHPAHVHFYRHMVSEFRALGHKVELFARDKDVTLELLSRFGLDATIGSRAGQGWLGLGAELLWRDARLLRSVRSFRPDVILTRSPTGCQVGRLTRTFTVFDTDDGRHAGVHERLSVPFADLVTTPDCLTDDYQQKHVRYPSYKALAFLHPHRFQPVPLPGGLGVGGDRYSVLRLVAFEAAHDHGEVGIDRNTASRLVDVLSQRGRVVISSERPLGPELAPLGYAGPPERFHDLLAGASLVVGDGPSVTTEAALLGVPSVFVSTFARRLDYPLDLEARYGLIRCLEPSGPVLDATLEMEEVGRSAAWLHRHDAMLNEKVDLTSWYVDFAEGLRQVVGR